MYYTSPVNSKLAFGSTVGGTGTKAIGAFIGAGNLGESEFRFYYGSTGYYFLNLTSSGISYGYDPGNGSARTVYFSDH